MYEFHGWIKLAETTRDIDNGRLDQKCEKLSLELAKLDWLSGRAEILLQNGLYTLILNAIPNRRRSESLDLDRILGAVTKDFKGAYGLIYEYDEQIEILNGRGVYSVRVIKRGKCETRVDPFLSPTIPVVEDLT